MSQEDLEKRVKDRQTAYLYVSIYKADGGNFFGLLADLSKGGFKLTSEKPVEADKEYKLAIKNPHMSPADQINTFVAKALWSAEKEHGIFETGLQFVTASENAKALFTKLEGDFESTSRAIQDLDEESFIE
jgi:c-di-GMP-binding flagellar brake protein YcgR